MLSPHQKVTLRKEICDLFREMKEREKDIHQGMA